MLIMLSKIKMIIFIYTAWYLRIDEKIQYEKL
jgi:hypothetical protein